MATMNSGLGGPAGYGENVFSSTSKAIGTDDDGAVQVDVTSVFSDGIAFFGTTYTDIYISSNGLITFGAPTSALNNGSGLDELNLPAIVPFWDDININSGGEIYWDLDPANGQITITWDGVAPFSGSGNNSFQVVLRDTGSGDFDVEVIYGNIEYTSGGAQFAVAGITDGNGYVAEFDGSGSNAELATYESNDFGSGDPAGTLKIPVTGGYPEGYGVDGTSGDDTMALGYTDADGDAITTGGDQIQGGDGADSIDGDLGNDTIMGGAGDDTIASGSAGAAPTYIDVANGNNVTGTNGQNVYRWLAEPASNATIDLDDGTGGDNVGDGVADYIIVATTNATQTLAVRSFDYGTDYIVLPESYTITGSTVQTVGTNAYQATITVRYANGNGQSFNIQMNSTTSISTAGVFSTDATVVGTSDDDSLSGGDDADTFVIEDTPGNDTIIGGEGGTDTDVIDMSAMTGPVTGEYTGDEAGTITDGTNTLTFSEIEQLILTDQDDVMDATGSTTGVSIDAGGGADLVDGGSGDDSLSGGIDNDTISGNAGADTIDGGDGADRLHGGQGGDSIAGGAGNDEIIGDGQWINPTAYASGGGAATTLTVINSADGPIELWWINGSGQLFQYGTIQPGATRVQSTFEDHNWILRDQDGYYLELIEGAANQTVTYGAEGLADSIDGGAGNDTIYGQFGDDTVDGGNGADLIFGGAGNDSLGGGSGDDTIRGGEGDDTIKVGTGVDLAYGEAGDDLLIDGTAGGEATTLYGGDGNDTIQSGTGNALAQYFGDAGNDRFEDLGGNNQTFDGGADSDTYVVLNGIGNDTIIGGEGITTGSDFDTIDLSAVTTGVTVTYTGDEAGTITDGTNSITFSEIENLVLTQNNDSLNASADTSGIVVDGAGGNDTLTGGSGNDTILGGDGNDRLRGGAGNDSLSGGVGNDSFYTDAGADTMVGGTGRDNYFVEDGFDGDVIDFGGDEIVLDNGGFSEYLSFYNVTTAVDIVFTSDSGGTATSAGGETMSFDNADGFEGAWGVGGTFDASLAAFDVTFYDYGGMTSVIGSDFNDNLAAYAADPLGITDRIYDGGAGNDELYTGDGNDTVLGGTGNDILVSYDGNDSLDGGEGDDTLMGGDGDDTLFGSAGNDQLEGGGDQDVFLIAAGEGDDTVQGGETGTDFDTLVVEAGSIVTYDSGNPEAGTIALASGGTIVFSEIESIQFFDVVDGTSGDDSIGAGYVDAQGDAVDGVVDGADGIDDTILAGAGNDTIDAGIGDDTVEGGTGNDQVFAWTGDDSVLGGDGNDTIFGQDGADTIYGGAGNDPLDGDDAVAGADVIFGEAGDDTIIGDGGNDTLSGGADNDMIFAGADDDSVSGGDGNDQIFGEGGHDSIDAGAGDDTLDGWIGDDTITGGLGDDQITGGDGVDTFVYTVGDGHDTITDFNFGNTGTLNDDDTLKNDFIDLSDLYDNLSELYADHADDGVLNQSNAFDLNGNAVDYSDNSQFGPGDSLTFSGATAGASSFTVENTGVVCFAKGTLIATAGGEIPIEHLRPGDLVVTRDNGVQAIIWVGSRRVSAQELMLNPKLRPIWIDPHITGGVAPLIVSPQHGLVVRVASAKETLVRATHLARLRGGRARVMQGCKDVTYFHLMFEAHQILYANGAPAESFYPGPNAFAALPLAARAEVLTLFPGLAPMREQERYGSHARPLAHFRELPDHLDGLTPAAR